MSAASSTMSASKTTRPASHDPIAGRRTARARGPAHSAAAGNRNILLRLQNNIKGRLLQSGRAQQALEVIGTMLMIAPREAALSLEHFLDLGAEPESRHEAATLLQRVKPRLN